LNGARPVRFGKGLALVLGTGLLLKTIYAAAVLANPVLRDYWVLDSKEYLALGSRLVAGGLEREVFSSSPLYVWLVAHTCSEGRDGTVFLLILQQIVGLATAGCIGAMGRHLFGATAGLIGAAFYLLYGGGALLEVKILPATFAVFLATLGLCGCVWSIRSPRTWRRAVVRGLAGSALGAAALCKPDLVLALPVVATGAWLLQRGSLRSNFVSAGACVAGFCAAVLPATLHNLHAGEFVPISSQGGITFYQGNNSRAEGTLSVPEGFSGNKATQNRETIELAGHALGRVPSDREAESYWYGRGLSFLTDNPGKALWLWGRKLVYWISSNELSAEYTLSVEREMTWTIWLFPVPFGLLLVLGLVGLFRRAEPLPAGAVVLWALIGTNLSVNLIFYCSSRYRLIAVPPLTILAGDSLVTMWRERRRLAWILPRAAGLALAVALTFIPARTAVAFQAAAQWYLYGNEALRRGEYQHAIACYEHALKVRRRTPNLEFNLAQAYAQVGNFSNAAQHMARALALNPGDTKAQELAAIYAKMRDHGQR
jgi:tetratricopeptide (TPR) repeat protein